MVAGTWLTVSAKASPDGENRDFFSFNPSGLPTFTKDLRFSDVLVNPEVPSFASSDRAMGMASKNKAVVAGDLALYVGLPRLGGRFAGLGGYVSVRAASMSVS